MIHHTTLQLLIAGIRWHAARNTFNATVSAHFAGKQDQSRRAFLSRVYVASKCETANSPAANLVMKSIAELTEKLKTLTPVPTMPLRSR